MVQAFGAGGAPKFTTGFQSSRGEAGRIGGVATDLTRPRGVAFAPDGGIAVADAFDERVGLFAADGTWTGLRGQVSASTGFATAGSNPGQFDLPDDVAYAAAGNLWVADAGNDRVQELAPDGRVLNAVAVGAPRARPTGSATSAPAARRGPPPQSR